MRAMAVLAALVILAAPAMGQDNPRLAFTTSTWGNANFSSWLGASGETGLQAADRVCQARAKATGLPEPEEFVAWLSDRDNDAYCRLLGLGGKRSENCGLAGPVPTAGPWIRTDGVPFADSLARLVQGKVLSPLLYSEYGQRIPFPFESFTATTQDGTLNTYFDEFPDCERWTSNSADPWGAFAPLGYSSGTTDSWTDSSGAVSCNGTRRLACMQKGQADPLPDRSAGSRPEAFITEENVSGTFASVAGADAICVDAALAAGLHEPASFKALITSSVEGVSATSRFQNNGPWYRIDGVLFAKSKAEIVAGEVSAPLNVTEAGTYVGYAVALTGANVDGSPSTINCDGWTNIDAIANGSLANLTFFGPSGGHNWLKHAQGTCRANEPNDWPRKLYCLSDTELLMRDGFEGSPPLPE